MINNIDELKKYFNKVALLLDIELNDNDVSVIFKFTNYDIPVKDDDNRVYKPLAFTLNDVNYSISNSIDNIKITIDNTQQTFNSIFLNSDQRKNKIEVSFAVLDDNGNVDIRLTLFSGLISSIQINNKQIEITAKSELVYWNTSPLRIYTTNLFPNIGDISPTKVLKWGSK